MDRGMGYRCRGESHAQGTTQNYIKSILGLPGEWQCFLSGRPAVCSVRLRYRTDDDAGRSGQQATSRLRALHLEDVSSDVDGSLVAHILKPKERVAHGFLKTRVCPFGNDAQCRISDP